MKKTTIFLLFTFCFGLTVWSQAKKPSIMVVPSDVWCKTNGFGDFYEDDGIGSFVPDYIAAVQSSSELMNVISKLNSLMQDRGFPLKDLSQTIKSLTISGVENDLMTSKSGSSLASNSTDMIKQRAKADIIMEIDWTINTTGPKQSVTYNLRGLDSYTNKQVAGAQGTGLPSFSAEIPMLIEEAVLVNMDNFTNRLLDFFDDLFENGREVAIDIRVFDNGSGLDLETEFDGDELLEIIENWMSDNTVLHRYNLVAASENFMSFEEVRIPLFDERERPIDVASFIRELSKKLKKAPYNITNKVNIQGLGKVQLILGEK